MAASIFKDVEMAPAIEVFQLTRRYNEDTFPQKVNLGVGAYRTDDGKPWVLPVVNAAETQMVSDALNHEYLPVAGLPAFRNAAIKLILGEDSPAIAENRVEGIQCLGGTGCIRLCAEFLKKIFKYDTVYVSKPTWGNHRNIFKHANFSNIKEYRYWDAKTRGLDFEGMLEDLNGAPENSAVILHAVAHNPTGVDPTEEQWKAIADVCEAKKIFVLMDNAYQGFATGDLDRDAFAARYFVSRGFEFFIAQSFSKNFGLYNERTGNLCIVAKSSEVISQVRSQCEILVRTMWSNPPNHGGRVVATVLNNKSSYAEWKDQVKTMADRIQMMRKLMFEKLRAKGTPGTWDHIIKQIGMFCYTGLNAAQVEHLINKFHIYLTSEGRINVCGLTTSNMDYVTSAIADTMITVPSKL
ncbi:aspartate aminotransferase, cytoplasmic-like isoform X1 [Haliotis rufescens]|uniref:aspartate aminotransferase, cytoplasmic-like isoform X1 n=1 Tax=Haliotis rufescens TaxID=6454 RepID=UPI001EAFFD6A|nr:aspartate aminotransferase, cytoplasmic-like isoform X1 [Haliotis rufescens]